MTGEYREHEPTDALKPFVECLWTRVCRPGRETRVLPDGAVDIIFDLAAPSSSAAGFVVGTMTAPVVVKSSRPCDFVAVRFHPGASQPLFGISMRELSDRRVDLSSIWASQVAPDWTERLKATDTTPSRVRLLQRLLIARIVRSAPPEPRVREAVSRIRLSGGTSPVDSLSDALGLTRQHLTRLFDFHIGVGVKVFSRILRMRRVMSTLERVSSERSRLEWATLAADLGYFDQSHFVREFRLLTGVTPERFRRSS